MLDCHKRSPVSEVINGSSLRPALKKQCTQEKKAQPKKWTPENDALLCAAITKYDACNWKAIATLVPGRTHAQCLQRWAKVLKPGLKKGPWTTEEDAHLTQLVQSGEENWTDIAGSISGRTSKQCRERWFHHLDPSIKRSPYTEEEDALIMSIHNTLGSKWALIARQLPGRTGEAVKTRFKTLNRHHKSGSRSRCPQVTRRRLNQLDIVSVAPGSPTIFPLATRAPAVSPAVSPATSRFVSPATSPLGGSSRKVLMKVESIPMKSECDDKLDWVLDLLDGVDEQTNAMFDALEWDGVKEERIDIDDLLIAIDEADVHSDGLVGLLEEPTAHNAKSDEDEVDIGSMAEFLMQDHSTMAISRAP